MQPTLTHIALHCADIDASIAFYSDYCGLQIIHDRTDDDTRVVWVAEEGEADKLFFVLIDGGGPEPQKPDDFSHVGFELDSREAVTAIAARADTDDILAWPARDEPYPVGYFCGVADPDGRIVEFSHDQPPGDEVERRSN